MKPSCVIVWGTRVIRSALKSDELVTTLPRAAYTTARTFGRTAVFEFDAHLSRLVQSSALMQAALGSEGSATHGPPSRETLAPLLRSTLATAIRASDVPRGDDATAAAAAESSDPTHNVGELKLTCILAWGAAVPTVQAALASLSAAADDPTPDAEAAPPLLLVVHATPLAPRHLPPIRVLALGAPRSNAEAKDSEWVRARRGLEAMLAARGLEEAILSAAPATGGGGGLAALEGTQTNFFVVRVSDGAVQTAGEGVLCGTVRAAVLDACARAGIPVVLSPPLLSEGAAGGWRAAFLTSTSRLVLPVDEVLLPQQPEGPPAAGDAAPPPELCVALGSATDPTVQLLARAVLEHVGARSEAVL